MDRPARRRDKLPAATVLAVLFTLAMQATLFAQAPPSGPFSNGTRWASGEVCYRVDATAISWQVDIDHAAQDWTGASNGGFKFIRKQNPGECDNYVAEGWIDGYKGWSGYTVIETSQSSYGCHPDWHGCIDPPPNSTINRAHTVLESFTCPDEDKACICSGLGFTHDGRTYTTYNDTLGCGPVQFPLNYCVGWPGTPPTLGGSSIPNTNLLAAQYGLRWDTPGSYEVALHEFGHWLWFRDSFIFMPSSRSSAMDWYAGPNNHGAFGQLCGLAMGGGGLPDFYTLFPSDVSALNQLYP